MTSKESVDEKWKGLYKAGGIGWIIVGILYFVEIPMFFVLGSSLSSGDAALKNLAGQALIAQHAYSSSSWNSAFDILDDNSAVPAPSIGKNHVESRFGDCNPSQGNGIRQIPSQSIST